MFGSLSVINILYVAANIKVHFIKEEFRKRKIHPMANELFERDSSFRNYNHSLQETVDNYNWIKNNTRTEEYNLILEEIKDIDQQLEKAEQILNWNSQGRKDVFAHMNIYT